MLRVGATFQPCELNAVLCVSEGPVEQIHCFGEPLGVVLQVQGALWVRYESCGKAKGHSWTVFLDGKFTDATGKTTFDEKEFERLCWRQRIDGKGGD